MPSATRSCSSSSPPPSKRQRIRDMATDMDDHVQFSSTTMTNMSGDFAAGRHTRSQGPPPLYSETDSNASIPVHQDLQSNGKLRSSLYLCLLSLIPERRQRVFHAPALSTIS